MLVLFAALLGPCSSQNLKARSFYVEKFEAWKTAFSHEPKSYNDSLQSFADADDFIEHHNAKGLLYTVGHNQWSHLSAERRATHLLLPATLTPCP